MTIRLSIAALASLLAFWLSGCGASSPSCVPSPEVCDGIDNNCDGRVDEGFDVGAPCTAGFGACQRTGVKVCAPGGAQTVCNAVPGTPTAEICNGIDDDCNGLIDDGVPGCCAPADTRTCGVNAGACTPGTQTCLATRAWGPCLDGTGQPVVLPGQNPEVCNGIDDDCDGAVDNGDPGGGAACTTGLLGVCSPGTVHCVSGALSCVQNVAPSAEICDGLDNNCNGTIDEGDPGGGVACSTGLPGVCSAGTMHCQAGTLSCFQNVAPSAEICDGLDNNCNGQVDEGDPGGGAACSTGLLGVCSAGTRHCVSGALSCVQNVAPGAEICDGLDNNCNGQVDEGDPGGGAACSTGLLGVCSAGTRHCVSGALSCVQNVAPSAEICDGLDNNCDGQVDEGDPGGGGVCSTGQPGVCGPGTRHCQAGALACVQNVAPGPEVCDGLDNDCNGLVDDCPLTANVATSTACGASGCAVLTCQPGWFDRNGIYADGCESSI